MFRLLQKLFWGLFHWELLEETFEQTKNGLMLTKYGGHAYVAMWVRSWDNEGKETFQQAVEDIEKAGFVSCTRRHGPGVNQWV